MTTATIYIGLVEKSNSASAVIDSTESGIKKSIVDLDDVGCETFAEFKDKVDDGELGNWYRAEYETRQLNILDIVDIPEELPEGKPYLFSVITQFGEFEEYNKVLKYTNDPESEAHIIAKEERGSGDDDWDEKMNAYWFDGYAVHLPSYKELTPAQAEIYKMAESF